MTDDHPTPGPGPIASGLSPDLGPDLDPGLIPDLDDDVAAALAAAARAMDLPHNVEDTLESIVQAARVSVPGFDEVSVTVLQHQGKPETRASTGDLALDLDRLQYELDEGPCLDAARTGEVMIASDLTGPEDQRRWSQYAPRAVQAGVRCQMGLPLSADGQTVGGLNFYSTTLTTIDADARHVAELFAIHAALALGRANRERQLTEALETRTLIGTATGLIMARYQLSEQRAFHFLVRASSTSNIKLRKIADGIVWSADAQHSAITDQR